MNCILEKMENKDYKANVSNLENENSIYICDSETIKSNISDLKELD